MTTAYHNYSDYNVALSLADASPVYFWEFMKYLVIVIDPITGKESHISKATFKSNYVPRAACPPALKEKAAAVPSYRGWRMKQNAKGNE